MTFLDSSSSPAGTRAFVLLALLWLLPACSDPVETPPEEEEEGTVQVFFDPTLGPKRGNAAASWLAFPFPSDHRRLPSGKAKLQGFPNPDSVSLLESYIDVGEADLDGFGLNGAVHMTFDEPIDVASIPSEPSAFASAEAPIQIIDVSPSSPEYGKRRPLRWEYWAKRGKFVFENSLAVAPSWGFPLRERTTYALVVTTAVKGSDGKPLRSPDLLKALLAGAQTAPEVKPQVSAELYEQLHGLFAPLRQRLEIDGIEARKIAVATVFTTQDVTGQLAAIHSQLKGFPAPRVFDWYRPRGATGATLNGHFQWKSGTWVDYWLMEGSFESWNYQTGEIPYVVAGGGLNVVDGVPAPARSERLHFVLTIPKTPPAGGGCYPIVEVAHGTGGDAYSFYDDGTAGRLAARGMAGVGLDQPLHGLRKEGKDFDENEMSFNYLNPESSRANFRQSAIDTFALTRLIQGSLKVPADISPTGQEICFRGEDIGFFGHSHGGLTGAIAAAYEHEIGSWLFSGAGGGLAITVTERKDIVDVKEAVTQLLGLGPDEPLSEQHPVMTLIQLLVDVTDPINYAPYWVDRDTYGHPVNVMLTSGLHDEETPHRTARALALSARIPAVAPLAIELPEYDWAGIPIASSPVSLDAPVSADSKTATAGFLQFKNDVPGEDADSHFLIFYRPEAIHASMRFLQSGVIEGRAVIERDPDADAR